MSREKSKIAGELQLCVNCGITPQGVLDQTRVSLVSEAELQSSLTIPGSSSLTCSDWLFQEDFLIKMREMLYICSSELQYQGLCSDFIWSYLYFTPSQHVINVLKFSVHRLGCFYFLNFLRIRTDLCKANDSFLSFSLCVFLLAFIINQKTYVWFHNRLLNQGCR